jgi:O-antigen ligase
VLVLALLLGGGTEQGLWTSHLIQLALAPAMLVGISGIFANRMSAPGRMVMCCILALLFVQFLPVHRPPAFDGSLGGGWGMWSLSPGRSLESFAAAVAGFGFLLYVARLDDDTQMRLNRVILIGVAINLLVAMVQLSFDQRATITGMLPFKITAGLFANENHLTTLVLASVPFLAWRLLVRDSKPLVFLLAAVFLAIVLFALDSRAGVALLPSVAIVTYLWFTIRRAGPLFKLGVLTGAMLLALTVVAYFDLYPSLAEEMRPVIFRNTLSAIADHWLMGAGIGTFPHIYPAYETPQEMTQVFVNHAHNDYLELALETGLAGVILLVALAGLLVGGFRRNQFSQAAFLALFTVALHSFVDYPLRTPAVAVLCAFCAGVILSERKSGVVASETAAELIANVRKRRNDS